MFKQEGTTVRKEKVEERFVDYLSLFEFESRHLVKMKKYLADAFKHDLAYNKDQFANIETTLAERNSELDYYVKLNRDGDISKATFRDRVAKLEAEITSLQVLLETRPKRTYDVDEVVQLAEKYLTEPGFFWEQSPHDIQTSLQRFYFPSGTLFNGHYFLITEMCNVFKLKSLFEGFKFPKVTLLGIETLGSLPCKAVYNFHTISRRPFSCVLKK
jgi:hypothetical protein